MGDRPLLCDALHSGCDHSVGGQPELQRDPQPAGHPQISSPLYTSVNDLLAALIGGAIDATTSDDLTIDLLPRLKQIEAQGQGVLVEKANASYEHLDFETQRAPFNDVAAAPGSRLRAGPRRDQSRALRGRGSRPE